jgi:hypothetical protein
MEKSQNSNFKILLLVWFTKAAFSAGGGGGGPKNALQQHLEFHYLRHLPTIIEKHHGIAIEGATAFLFSEVGQVAST